MSSEHKRKLDDNGGPVFKFSREESRFGPEAQALLDEKVADGTALLERHQRLQFSMVQLDDKVLRNLTELSPSDQANVLRQFFRTEIPSMKNPSAYLSGIIRSSRTTSGSNNGMNSAFMKRSPVGRQLEHMYRQYDFALRSIMKPGDLDDKLMQRIMEEPPELVITALQLFEASVPSDCRNRSAFFTSQLKIAAQRLGFNVGRGYSSPGGPARGPGMMRRGPAPMHSEPFGRGGGFGFDGSGMMPPGGFSPPQPGGRQPRMPPNGRDPIRRSGGSEMGGLVRDYTTDQINEGVRVDEFHSCSEFARFVAPFAAKELQNQFDNGMGLVDILDARSWRQLAALRPGEALDICQEMGEAMRTSNVRNPNAFFASIVRKRNPDISERADDLADAVARGDIAPPTATCGPMGGMGGGGANGAPVAPARAGPLAGGPLDGHRGPPNGRLAPGAMPPSRSMPQPETQAAYEPLHSAGVPQMMSADRTQAVMFVHQPHHDNGAGSGPMAPVQGGMGMNGMAPSMHAGHQQAAINSGGVMQMQSHMVSHAGGMPGAMGGMAAMSNGAQAGLVSGMHDNSGMGGSGTSPGGGVGGPGNMRGGSQIAQGYAQGYQRNGATANRGASGMGMGGDGLGGAGPNMISAGAGTGAHPQWQQQSPQQQQFQAQAPPQQTAQPQPHQQQGMMQQAAAGYMPAGSNNMQRTGQQSGAAGFGGMQPTQAQQPYDPAGGYAARAATTMYQGASPGTQDPSAAQYGGGNNQYAASNPQYGPGSQYSGSTGRYSNSGVQYSSHVNPQAQAAHGSLSPSMPAANVRATAGGRMYGAQMHPQPPGVGGGAPGGAVYSMNAAHHSQPSGNAQPPTLSQQVQNRIKQLVASSNGEVRFEHFDAAVCSALAKIPVPSALSAIESIDKSDKRGAPSLQAFMLSAIQQYH